MVFDKLNVLPMNCFEVRTFLYRWSRGWQSKDDRKVWWLVLDATFRALSNERHSRMIRKESRSADRVTVFLFDRVKEWASSLES